MPISGGSSGAPLVAPVSLFGNAGTVAANGTNIAIGANITLSPSGTLSAAAGGGGGIGTIIASGISSSAASQSLNTIPYTVPSFTNWLNQGTATATANATGPLVIGLAAPAAADNIRSRYMPLAGGDFQLTTQADMWSGPVTAGSPTFGPILTNGTATAIFSVGYARTVPIIAGHVWNNVNTLSISLLGSDIPYGNLSPKVWQRITLTGTSYTFSVSLDGFTFNQVGPSFTSATVGFTPSGIGIGLEEFNAGSGTGPFSLSLNYWLKTP